MDNRLQQRFRLGAPLVLVVALLVLSLGRGNLTMAAPSGAPAGAPQADTLPADTCTYDEGTNTRTCELWATPGTLDLPDGASVPIWGYTDTNPATGGTASLPGPTIIANEGEAVEIILHNDLTETTAMVFPGQEMVPDLTGVAPGGDTAYSFTATSPGTYLYEAGLLPNAQHQVAMGLYGGLVVRPELGATYAYDDATTMFVDEALLVLSDIDPALNTSADPVAFDMRDYAPTYFLINGQAYPDTEEIPSGPGNRILLRTVNAGVVQHPLGVLGMHQEVIATDGHPLSYPYQVAAATIGSGQTSDRIVTVPGDAGTAGDSRYAVYDTSMLLHNNGAAGFGGMLTFIFVPDGAGVETGPTSTAVEVAPNPTDGSKDAILTATIPGATSAEYFIDWVESAGTGTAMSAAGDEWAATIAVADLNALVSGYHTIYVHGSDGTNWGPINFDVLHLDKLGPASRGLTLTPNPSSGAVSVTVSATGDDRATGNSVIAAAETFIDATGADGSGTPLTVNVPQSIASLDGTIDAATMGELPEGEHTIYVHSMDAFGWWGDYVTDTLVVDQTGPTTSDVVVDPSPNNGALPYNPTRYAVRVAATVTDTSSAIERAEGFIDTVGDDGSGFPLTPSDALFDELVEDAYVYIPLSTINQLAEGTHQIWIHGQDAAGNWGEASSGQLFIDKTGPTVSNVVAVPNPTRNETIVTLTADAADSALTIVRAEWFDGGDPGTGNGTPMEAADGAFDGRDEGLTAIIDVSDWRPGDHTISVRAQDAAGNWSAATATLLCVRSCNAIFADSFASGDTTAWTVTTGDVDVIPAAAMDDDGFGMAANLAGDAVIGATSEPQDVESTDGAYVTDETPDAETSYHARFAFDPNGAQAPAGSEITLLDGQDGGGATIFKVEYRRLDNGDAYQVRGVVMTAGGEQITAWVDVEDGATNFIEIGWEADTSASFDLYVDNWLEETLTGLDTSAYTLETVHMGPSGGIGLDGDAWGWVHLDVFESARYEVIGPPYRLWLPLVMQTN